jgi:hemin uptake protein HemP
MCEWAAEDVPKVIEARKKTTIPSAIKVIAELSLFGQHKGIFIYDSPDEKNPVQVPHELPADLDDGDHPRGHP